MAYSRINKLRVKNFRNIGLVDIDFTKSPIVTLVGENEAGKTSIIKAFSMCALHDSPRDQKDYIRDGTKALAVGIELEDGTSILRYKELNGANIYKVINADGKEWETSKITDGLPKKVSDLMGLIVEPETGEYLNIRTYEDKLLFVVTPNSVNYKVMYNALKVEQLTKAIKLGSDEVNELKSEVSHNESSIRTLDEQLKSIEVHDIAPLVSIKGSIQKQLSLLDKVEHIKELSKKLVDIEYKLGAYELINVYKLDTINEVTALKLNNIGRLLERKADIDRKSQHIDKINTLNYIETSNLDKVISIVDKLKQLEEKDKIAERIKGVEELGVVSESMVVHINKIRAIMDRIGAIENKLREIDTDSLSEININQYNKITKMKDIVNKIVAYESALKQYDVYIEQLQSYLEQCGVAVETCPKCGEAIIFDLDKLK